MPQPITFFYQRVGQRIGTAKIAVTLRTLFVERAQFPFRDFYVYPFAMHEHRLSQLSAIYTFSSKLLLKSRLVFDIQMQEGSEHGMDVYPFDFYGFPNKFRKYFLFVSCSFQFIFCEELRSIKNDHILHWQFHLWWRGLKNGIKGSGCILHKHLKIEMDEIRRASDAAMEYASSPESNVVWIM